MYCFQAPGRPTLTLIKGQSGTFHGTISGLQEWSNEQALASALRLSYPMLPANWATGIAMQVCAGDGGRGAVTTCMLQVHAVLDVLDR